MKTYIIHFDDWLLSYRSHQRFLVVRPRCRTLWTSPHNRSRRACGGRIAQDSQTSAARPWLAHGLCLLCIVRLVPVVIIRCNRRFAQGHCRIARRRCLHLRARRTKHYMSSPPTQGTRYNVLMQRTTAGTTYIHSRLICREHVPNFLCRFNQNANSSSWSLPVPMPNPLPPSRCTRNLNRQSASRLDTSTRTLWAHLDRRHNSSDR